MHSKTALIFDQKADWYAHELGGLCQDYQFVAASTHEEAVSRAANADILVGLAPYIKPDLIAAMPNLEWVQALTTGVDNLLAMDTLPKDVVITNCNGFHGPQMSELTLLLMLSLGRNFPTMLENQKSASWQRWPQPLLAGKTACLVGLGAIAETLAKRCLAMEMRVTGVSNGRTELEGFDRIYKRSDIESAAGDADFLIVIVPYSDETHNIINARILSLMKQSAFLINISRGGCVDEEALVDALDAGRIAGAGMDVFATEPLPADSPLWQHPKIIVTPHIGGMADIYHQQALPLVAENLNKFALFGADGLTGKFDR
ncbi:D-2-hydroxyacid dehydrogenase [Pararhizobium sp. IMCC21322]|uniref:D-2-hydroxyacid dehydrogenase n=1 Tax=Pararhizobium sp. IMCC21322 TaxID=3067903 RepID=UPI002741B607|nr:D-2-hydroxyacid dehydrogenase [Pararhizobium sp. IMCC21322]